MPFEMCALNLLTELRAANNQLNGLPLEFGYLTGLEKLHLQKNKIKELPEASKSFKFSVISSVTMPKPDFYSNILIVFFL